MFSFYIYKFTLDSTQDATLDFQFHSSTTRMLPVASKKRYLRLSFLQLLEVLMVQNYIDPLSLF